MTPFLMHENIMHDNRDMRISCMKISNEISMHKNMKFL